MLIRADILVYCVLPGEGGSAVLRTWEGTTYRNLCYSKTLWQKTYKTYVYV